MWVEPVGARPGEPIVNRPRFSLAQVMLVILAAAVVFAILRLVWDDPEVGVLVVAAAVVSSAAVLLLARRLRIRAERLPESRSAVELAELVRHRELGSISLLTLHEVAQLLRCPPRTVEQLVESGKLSYVDFAPGGGRAGTQRGSWRFRPMAIEALLDGLETTRTPADATQSRPAEREGTGLSTGGPRIAPREPVAAQSR